MTVTYANATKNARLDQVTADAGATAFLQIWNGAIPGTPSTAPAGTLLASLPMSNPIAPAAATGVLTLSAITTATALADGTPTFARIATSESGTTTGVAQLTAGVGSGDVSLSAALTNGSNVASTGGTLSTV